MMQKYIIELIEIINVLEQESFEKTDTEYFNFELITNGNVIIVKFIGITIYNSEDEDRDYDEIKDCYEDMEIHLRKILNKELKKLRKLKF